MSEDIRVYKETVGVNIDLDMEDTVTGASSITFYVVKPSGATDSWTGAVNGTEVLRYTTLSADDLDEDGEYLIQPKFTLGGWTGRGNTVRLYVFANHE